MRGTVLWRYMRYVLLLSALTKVLSTHAGPTDHGQTHPRPTDPGPTVWLQPDTDYIYEYDGFTHIKEVALIKVTAQVVISSLLSESHFQRCRLTVKTYNLLVNQRGTDVEPNMPAINLTNSMLFDMSTSGEVRRVYYPENEDAVALTLKKILLGTLSSRLEVSETQRAAGTRWAYRVNETGHEGSHSAMYHARPLHDEIIYTKIKHTKALENAKQDHTKIVRLNTTMKMPSKVIIKESFHSPNELSNSYRPTMPEHGSALATGNAQLNLPSMGGTSTAVLTFVRTEAIQANLWNMTYDETASDMVNSSLKVDPIPPANVRLENTDGDIKGNMSCIVIARAGEIHTGLSCFREFVKILKRLDVEDLDKLTQRYLHGKQPEVVRQTMIDALGTAHTSDCYTVMMRRVFLVKDPEAELLMRALFQLVDLSTPAPEIIFSTLEHVVFSQPFTLHDEEVTELVRDRATLVLAAVVDKVKTSRPLWAHGIVDRLERRLGIHDPYHHRQLRSTMTEKELLDHLNWKTLHIHALGNAVSDSSLGHLLSYVNDSNSHIALRSSAVDALAKYKHKDIADLLLSVALTDHEDNVRLAAVNGYKKHPHGGDIRTLLDPVYGRTHNVTQRAHSRMKRSLSDTLSRIWKGFYFRLESPSINWVKHVGGSKLGASIGLIVRNLLDIQIRPLQGHLQVDVLDSAFATIHIGLFGIDFDIFRGELCFKGGIQYGLNILKEYGYDAIQKFADLYDKVVKKVITTIKESVNSFKELVSTFKNTKFSDILKNLIESVKQLPSKVFNLRRIGKRLYKAIGKFVELPPVVTHVKDLVTKVTTLFNDIKTDVMKLYNAIADSINTVIPWAWKEIKTAFEGIRKGLKKLLKNPQSAIQDIGEAIARISTAITGIIDAKKKIVAANFFSKENRPYWFDIKKELKDIWERVKGIKKAITDTITWLKTGPSANDIAERFTGVDLATMKRVALTEVMKVLEEELAGPLGYLKQLLAPFLQAYDFITSTVKNIKIAWRLIVNGYQTARTLLEEIFGPKMHEDFPRKLLESAPCGDGFWETDGKGHYSHKGIMLNVTVGNKVVAPFGGMLRKTGPRQITIAVSNMKEVEVIVDNINLNIVDRQVGAGEVIGVGIAPFWCSDSHIHVAMIKTSNKTIDPTSYLRKRKMPPPKWVQECDHYILRWLGKDISQGSILGAILQNDTTPEVIDSTDTDVKSLTDDDGNQRTKRDLFDKFKEFAKRLGLPDISKLKEVFSFDMNSITVNTVLGYLDKIGLSKLKTKIIKILKEVESMTNHQSCVSPETMDDVELKQALVLRGLPTNGARQTLIDHYLKSDPQCLDIGSRIGKNVYCRFDESCTSVSCCVDLKLFIYRHALTAYVRYDACDLELIIGINKWTTSFKVLNEDFTTEDSVDITKEINVLNVIQLMANLKIQRTNNMLKVSLGVAWCSTRSEECLPQVVIMAEAQIEVGPCVSNATLPVMTRPADTPTVDKMLNMSIGDVIKLVDVSGVDEKAIVELVKSLRDAFKNWLTTQIKNLIVKIFGSEFERFDICTTGLLKSFGPYYVEIYKLNPPIIIPIGPIPLSFLFGIDGHYGATFYCKLCIMTMKASATIVPRLGSSVWGSVGVTLFVLRAELRLTGYLLTTSFPTTITIEFKKFPLEVRARMDLNLIPLRIELRARLVFELCIWLPWVGKKCIKKTLINILLWHYQTKAINKNILNYNDAEPDFSAPDFGWYSKATCSNCDDDSSGSDDSNGGSRRRRSIGSSSAACHVTQLAGRDYTEPAFNIEFGVADDRSEVELSFCVGTFSGGCDVIDNEPLGGASTVVAKTMIHSVPLYFRVTATNSMGLSATTTCQLQTYDMTLPVGRVTPDFRSTSHPELLQGSTLAFDDSVIVEQMISAGYGKGSHGTQIVDWRSVSSSRATGVDTGNDPLGLRLLEHFTAPREGRLVETPLKTARYQYAEACARDCLSYPATVCLSFNYDYGPGGECQLMRKIEGHTTYVRLSGRFHHFERRGIGHVTSVRFRDLRLHHNTIVYLNYYLRNAVDYKNIISSGGVMVDMTPPTPGVIANSSRDSFTHDVCGNYVPRLWRQRCAPDTTAFTHRTIVDGEGSQTVFNGPEAMTDKLYTRANRMIDANWDGIRDNETRILVYTWAVGTAICGDDIVPYNDPHEHIASPSEWTFKGLAFPLKLPDNKYYVTVRAINDIEFGPLALTVCHAQPYAVDTTPPIIYAVDGVKYDEDTFLISFHVNATDPVSGIKSGEVGLGRSRRDTYLLAWSPVNNFSHVQFNFRVPDGVPAWVKTRVTNNVDLSAVGHSDRAIIVDKSPPLPGNVYDGNQLETDLVFQSSAVRYCANWRGFSDPQSGLSRFEFALGTTAGSDDVIASTSLDYDVTSNCADGLRLFHKHIYYASVTAVNGGLVQRNVTVYSDGVYIDVTAPVKGLVKDGKDPNNDEKYTSEAATVACTWTRFSDPESGLKGFEVDIFRKPAGAGSTETVIHTEKDVAPDASGLTLHHFHLHHGDFVRVDVSATNRAEASTAATSDGFTVDMTDPNVLKLVDGGDINEDKQFTDSTTALAASWSFVDEESGIVHYKVSAYELHGGKKTLVYPKSSPWKTVPGGATSWTTDETLSLKIGAHYRMRVAAVNGAGLTAVHYTDGVLVDPTPPKMLFVHAGVFLGEDEEVIDGYVIHNDEGGIQASWGAMDAQSGITGYFVGIGTAPGSTDVLGFRSVGLSRDEYIDNVNLALTDKATNLPVYYVTVKALNGAGKESAILSSSPIRMVAADVAGVVTDGPDMQVDTDYQLHVSEVTVTFSGYKSERDGVTRYAWAVGSAPRFDDVMPYSYIDLVTVDGVAPGMLGISGSGKGQSQLTLSAGVKYYTSVRAVTGAGHVLESTSDGFLVDTTPPAVTVTSVGARSANTTSVLYQRETDSYTAAWSVADPGSPVADVELRLGTYPEAGDIHSSLSVTNMTDLPLGYVTPRAGGLPNILTLDARNDVGLTTTKCSPVLVVDTTAPLLGLVSCPKYVQGGDSLECSWSGFVEKESEIDYYKFGIGKAEGDDSVYVFRSIGAGVNSYRATGMTGGGLKHRETYFVTVVAVNKVGLETTAYSQPLVVDDTPPRGRLVVELPDIYVIAATGTNSTENDLQSALAQNDAVCQRALTQVIVAWQPFEDPETQVTRYQVALGSTPGGAQIRGFEDVEIGKLTAVVRGVDLSRERHVFAAVKGFNAAGLQSTATSNGVYISRVSSGKEPLRELLVQDGSDRSKDLDFQDDNDGLSAHWDFTGDPCPIAKYEWGIYRFDGSVVVNMTTLHPDVTEAAADELPLKDGESYFVVVRATNQLGYVHTVPSDGVTVRLEPLLPGNVRDGDIIGKDLNYQPSVASLSANWDGFGQPPRDSGRPVVSKVNSVDATIGKHQEIERYEVAVGTDRRFHSTRNNVRPFTNAGLNVTWTFSDLKLIPRSSIYYVTVRAYSVSSAMVEVTSNGIQVGYGGPVVSNGTLELAKYVSSATDLSFSWSGFKFDLPVKFYDWAIGTPKSELNSINCASLVHKDLRDSAVNDSSSLFDVHPLTTVNLDTYVKEGGLSLTQGESYQVVVIATDEAGGCVEVTGIVTVDTTAPLGGTVGVGPNTQLKLLYSPMVDALTAWWTGLGDPESGIKTLEIRLLSGGGSCLAGDNLTTVVDWTELSPNSTDYRFAGISLRESETYFVELRVTNGADLSRTVVSRPILLDIASPSAGGVKHGDDFETDLTYQSSVSHMHGVFLYLPTASGASCPQRVYPMTSADTRWNPLVHKQLRRFNRDRQDGVVFRDFQLSYTEEGLGVTMRRDVRTNQMLSGATQTAADVNSAGQYSFEIRAASGALHAVTSVVFLDAPAGVFADYTPLLFDGDTAGRADIGPRKDGVTIIHDGLPGDTSVGRPDGEGRERKGFGFQIYPNATYLGHTSDWIVLWSTMRNKSMHTVTELDFDPAGASHVYWLDVNGDDPKDVNDYWDLKLFADDTQLALLSGATNVSSSAQLTIGVYGRHGWVAPLEDPFNPPESTAFFRNLKFPAPPTDLCRFGDPFRGSSHPIVAFLAAVGTSAYATDVADFQKVSTPCIPCQHPCDEFVCNDTCAAGDTQVIHVHLSGITLTPRQAGHTDNDTQLQPYYLTVKAVTGSGRAVTATSRGVYIDVTPPVIQMMYHVDLAWSKAEPTAFQGGNSSLALYFEVVDPESGVVETWWSIGSTPGGADVQPLVSVGVTSFLMNSSLAGLLHENHTYYVTLVCRNGAGLTTTNSSLGVTILTVSPNTANITTSPVGTESFAGTSTSVKTKRQDEVGVAWDKPPGEEHIDGVYFSVGTDKKSADLYPEQQVGFGDYGGEVTLTSDGMKFTGSNETTVGHTAKDRRRRAAGGAFYMEPGRTMRVRLRACSKSHRCSDIPVKPILVVRDTDAVAKAAAGELSLTLTNTGKSTRTVTIKALNAQREDAMLAGGFLAERDVNAQYLSAASDTFKTFIVDPDSTKDKTDRYLRNRLRDWDGEPFYVTTLPDETVDGPLSITTTFDKSRVQDFVQDIHPRLLRWCADEDMWIDAGRSCDLDSDNRRIDWEKGTVTVKVCHSAAVCSRYTTEARGRRAATGFQSQGVSVYSQAGVKNKFVNSPPVIKSESSVDIFEDQKMEFTIKAKDLENDQVSFLLNSTAPASMGNVSVTLDGTLSYVPCRDCYGIDTVYFTVLERRTDGETALSVDGTLDINIIGTNDSPQLHLFREGRDIVPPNSKVTITVEENNEDSAAYEDVVFVVAATDADYEDDVKLTFESPKHGNFTVYSVVKNVNATPQDCDQPWHSRRHLWGQLVNDISSSDTVRQVRLPEPCDDDMGKRHLAVVVTVFKYRPVVGYFGADIIKVSATDQQSFDLLVINVLVLRNPCVNQGVCEGPETDPECTSTNRTNGFSGYICRCPLGYSGDYCETDIDECLSSPCPTNYSCVNSVGRYECFCNPTWPCHVTPPTMESWQVALVSVGSVIGLVFIALGVVCLIIIKKATAKRRAISPMSSMSSEPRHGPFRGRWLYGFGQYENVLGHRLPSVYGQLEEPTPSLPRYKPGPRISQPKKPLYRPMGYRIPRPDYD